MVKSLIEALTTSVDVKLTKTSKISDLPTDRSRQLVGAMYEKPNSTEQTIGVFLNSLIVEGKLTFLFSKSILEKLIETDPNELKRRTLDSELFKSFTRRVFSRQIIEPLRSHTDNKAGVYIVVDECLKSIIKSAHPKKTDEDFEKQRQEAIDYYEGKLSYTKKFNNANSEVDARSSKATEKDFIPADAETKAEWRKGANLIKQGVKHD